MPMRSIKEHHRRRQAHSRVTSENDYRRSECRFQHATHYTAFTETLEICNERCSACHFQHANNKTAFMETLKIRTEEETTLRPTLRTVITGLTCRFPVSHTGGVPSIDIDHTRFWNFRRRPSMISNAITTIRTLILTELPVNNSRL